VIKRNQRSLLHYVYCCLWRVHIKIDNVLSCENLLNQGCVKGLFAITLSYQYHTLNSLNFCFCSAFFFFSNSDISPNIHSGYLKGAGHLFRHNCVSWASGFMDRQYSGIFHCDHAHCSNTWSGVLLEKLIATQLVNKFLSFHVCRRLITAFTRACHWTL
jgi:hypothetical protein